MRKVKGKARHSIEAVYRSTPRSNRLVDGNASHSSSGRRSRLHDVHRLKTHHQSVLQQYTQVPIIRIQNIYLAVISELVTGDQISLHCCTFLTSGTYLTSTSSRQMFHNRKYSYYVFNTCQASWRHVNKRLRCHLYEKPLSKFSLNWLK